MGIAPVAITTQLEELRSNCEERRNKDIDETLPRVWRANYA